MNTHLTTPHLPLLTQAHDLYLADASDFSQGEKLGLHESITTYAEVGLFVQLLCFYGVGWIT